MGKGPDGLGHRDSTTVVGDHECQEAPVRGRADERPQLAELRLVQAMHVDDVLDPECRFGRGSRRMQVDADVVQVDAFGGSFQQHPSGVAQRPQAACSISGTTTREATASARVHPVARMTIPATTVPMNP